MFPDVTRDDVFRIDGRRLCLRWPRAADAPVLQAWSRTGDLPAAADGERFLLAARADNAAGSALTLAVTQKGAAGRPPVGILILRCADEAARIDLGIVISPALRRRGFATEVLTTIMPALFGLTACTHVAADVRVADAVARRMLQRCGFARADDTRLRLDRRIWQRHHAVRRIPAMTHQVAARLVGGTSTAEA